MKPTDWIGACIGIGGFALAVWKFIKDTQSEKEKKSVRKFGFGTVAIALIGGLMIAVFGRRDQVASLFSITQSGTNNHTQVGIGTNNVNQNGSNNVNQNGGNNINRTGDVNSNNTNVSNSFNTNITNITKNSAPPPFIPNTKITHTDLERVFQLGYVVLSEKDGAWIREPKFVDKFHWEIDWRQVQVEPDFSQGMVSWKIPFSGTYSNNNRRIYQFETNEFRVSSELRTDIAFPVLSIKTNQPSLYVYVAGDNQASPVFVYGFRIPTVVFGHGVPAAVLSQFIFTESQLQIADQMYKLGTKIDVLKSRQRSKDVEITINAAQKELVDLNRRFISEAKTQQ